MTTIGILGLGLIGGSFALTAERVGHQVVAWDADGVTREEAGTRGLTVSPDLSAAELIVLAVPMPALTERLATTLAEVDVSSDATITDVGSLKQPVAAAMHAAGLAERYVGGHPMAGTERSGFQAASPDLFTGASWALCLDPDDPVPVDRWLRAAAVVTDLGAGVVPITPVEHDEAMAMVSGLPHLLALALSAAAESSAPVVRSLTAGSFADLTRVAGSGPALLHAVTRQNAPAVRAALRLVLDQLDRPWEDLIRSGHEARQSWPSGGSAGKRPSPEPQSAVPNAQQLLELGRAGTVIEAVDLAAGLIGLRRMTPPGRTSGG